QGAVRRQGGPGVAAREVDGAAVPGDGVVELVQGRHAEVEGTARRGRARGGDGKVGDRRGADRQRAARAGDGGVGRVGGGERLVAGGLHRGPTRGGAVGQGGVGRQGGLAVAAGEVDGAGVAGGRVVVGVQGRHREGERGAGRGVGRDADAEVRGHRRVDAD